MTSDPLVQGRGTVAAALHYTEAAIESLRQIARAMGVSVGTVHTALASSDEHNTNEQEEQ